MATRSRSTACPLSPLDQGELGPAISATTNEPTSLEPKVYGEVSLSRAISLLLGLQNQVLWLKQELKEQKEATKEARDWMGAVNQTLACVEARGGTPHTPEDWKPPAIKATPRPLSKTNPVPAPSAPLIAWANPTKPPITFAQPTPVRAPQESILPLHLCLSGSAPRKIGNESQQWLTRMMAWVRLNQRMFPTDQEVLLFLLMNMKDTAGAWAHPHLDQLGSHRAIIQTVEDFRREFLAAFGNLDATRAAERQITHLTQTGTCAEYITKFRTIAMDLDWNDAALRGQFAQGLHWELQNAALVIDNALREEHASHPPKGSKPGTSSTPNRGRVPANRPQDQDASPATPTLSPRRNKTAAGLKASASNAVRRAINLQNAAQAGKPHPRRKVISPLFTISIKPEKQADPLEVLIDSGATSLFLHPHTAEILRLPLIDLPQPRTVTMLDGSSPQAGKIWKKAHLTFLFDGKQMTETFLICNTGSHAAILGIKWLEAHSPEIDWNSRTLSFPHTPPEHATIAEEEEADQKPLEGVPSEYHQYAKLTEEGPLNSPLYSMTDAESATLKDWLRDELKAGKIRPSKSPISSPVMFVPKKDGSRRLVVDYCCLNNRTKKNVYPLPRPDDLMAQLRGAKIFTKLDLRWGYNNVRVKEDDATHTKHVHEVLKRLMDNQLFCKASKCTFHVTSVEYLGIIVLDKGFSLDKLKIQAVQEWPVPTKVKEVQLFLGFANFLHQFVANFSHMARPLHNLVRKDMPWKWDTREQEAFQGLKDAITNAPVLCHADPTKPYFLETDASGAALGSILSQRQEDGRLHPLGFLSESFKGAKQNYNTHDKELLAIIWSFEYWRIFLEGTKHPITVFTDHCNLEYWKESRTFNQQHARWHLLLAGYNFQIVYCPGKQSGKPDALSRQSDHADIPPAVQTMLPDPVFANIALVTPEKELQRQIEASLDQDESLEEILQFLQSESKAPPSIKRAFKDYKMEAGLLFYQGQIVVPDVGH
ncbi:hypothetical protein RHS01_09404 [Rhizoctonia solani]|uniref:Reverse transcriptase n=1 Tax=Rhizoctonia solani TaxID=456999 RepID=A0A8H7I7G2_9AGAM|nr:hypothetical protein RHS01_09404 [Rhizoctonia solani]